MLTGKRLFSMITLNDTILAFGGFLAAQGESQAAVEASAEITYKCSPNMPQFGLKGYSTNIELGST